MGDVDLRHLRFHELRTGGHQPHNDARPDHVLQFVRALGVGRQAAEFAVGGMPCCQRSGANESTAPRVGVQDGERRTGTGDGSWQEGGRWRDGPGRVHCCRSANALGIGRRESWDYLDHRGGRCRSLHRSFLGTNVQMGNLRRKLLRLEPSNGQDQPSAVHGVDVDRILLFPLRLARHAHQLHLDERQHRALWKFRVASWTKDQGRLH
mmetsp:Transcript_9832/g.27819  ORF Transcript_9832/g.27819 Transcript_9832/m.27819 type:complete len:208 (-) Transcript_9832:53-676(-)